MGKIRTMKLPHPLEGSHTYFVCSDIHSDKMDVPSARILIQHAEKHENPALIINGDLFDLPFMMKKNPNFRRWVKRSEGVEEFFLPEWERECEAVNLILDMFQKVFVKVIFMNGNHDSLRIEEFLKEIPFEYHHHFCYKSKLRLGQREIPVLEYGDWLDVGEVSLIHGLYHNANAHKTHHDECPRSLIFGHIHKAKQVPFKNREGTQYVWSLPCMCNLNPDYRRKQTSDWDNGYGILTVFSDGKFGFNVFIVKDGSVILPSGERIYAKKDT